MKSKLQIEKMADAINYFDVQPTFYKKDGKELTEEDLVSKGLTPEEDWPFDIKQFKKLGFGFSHAIFDCSDEWSDKNRTVYLINNENKSISIESDNFTIKEFFIIVDMINRHLNSSGAGQFVAFGNDNDETHTLFHEDATAFGLWWESLYKFYTDRINGIYKLKSIHIHTDDYETDIKGFSTKDRIIRIVFE